MIDVAVAGGGPAGLAAAIEARRAGFGRVVVFERSPQPVDKACGEGLMPGARAALHRLGVRELPGISFRGVRYHQGDRCAEARFEGGPGRGARRVELQRALLDRAEEVGVELHHRTVEEVHPGPDQVEVGGTRARWLLAADGLASPLRRRLGLERPPRRPRRFGLRRHYRVQEVSDHVEVYLAPGQEAYVTPVGPGQVGVALLFGGDAPRGPLEDRLARAFPALAARLGEPCTSPCGAGPFERRLRRRVAGRVLLVGDAAGFLDPLTGEGVQLGLASARAAVECLRRGDPAAYERAWWRLAREYWWLTELLLWARRSPWMAPRLTGFLAAWPGLFRFGLDRLAGRGPEAAAGSERHPAGLPLPGGPP